MPEEEYHLHRLSHCCRVCGKLTFYDYRHKSEFPSEFKQIWNVDITTEDNHSHGHLVCRAHISTIKRYQDSVLFGKKYHCYTPIVKRMEHTEGCEICIPVPHHVGGVQSSSDKRPPEPVSVYRPSKPLTTSGNDTNEIAKRIMEDMSAENRIDLLSNLIPKLSDTDAAIVARELGKTHSRSVLNDAMNISAKYHDINFLKNFSLEDWISERDLVVSAMIDGICFGKDFSSPKDLLLKAKAIEQIYATRYQRLVSPISFRQNVLLYHKTGSRDAVDILGAGSPAGSYTTVSSWLDQLSNDPVICPEGDMVFMFDNEQVNKNYLVL